jgi:hypothetical protein
MKSIFKNEIKNKSIIKMVELIFVLFVELECVIYYYYLNAFLHFEANFQI